MSTKIYNGKIIKASRLSDFHKWFYETCVDLIAGEIERAYWFVGEVKSQEYAKDRLISLAKNYPEKVDKLRNGNYFKYNLALELMFNAAASHGCEFNPSCGYNAYPYKGNILLTVYLPTTNRFHIPWPKYVREYYFWNNTDQPEDITEDQWNARGVVWNTVLDSYPCPIGCSFFEETNGHIPISSIKTIEAAFKKIKDFDQNHGFFGPVYDVYGSWTKKRVAVLNASVNPALQA